jgi:transcriptional regulator with XRE-family HTH domain
MDSFGKKLAECRKVKNLSQKELAELFKTSHTTIGKYEKEAVKSIKAKIKEIINK